MLDQAAKMWLGLFPLNPWFAVILTGVTAFALHILFVLAFRTKP